MTAATETGSMTFADGVGYAAPHVGDVFWIPLRLSGLRWWFGLRAARGWVTVTAVDGHTVRYRRGLPAEAKSPAI